jgi:hypothetical protein
MPQQAGCFGVPLARAQLLAQQDSDREVEVKSLIGPS